MNAEACGSDHSECAGTLRQMAAGQGVEVTVSTSAPLVAGPYTTDPFTCPHGVSYWIQPTGEQIAAWGRDGVA